MKITYSNAPHNKQRNPYPSWRAIGIMVCVIALTVAIRVFYAPNESIEDAAAAVNAPLTEEAQAVINELPPNESESETE